MRSLALSAALLASVAALPNVGWSQEVGTAGAVNPASTGTPPAKPTRVLQLGSRVIHRERINTAGGGNVQLVFIDKTTMSIGPNSDVVIDEFVYDPNAGTGRMAASMAKGVLRFVGGNTSHSGGAEIKTPAATLGIRGGVATVRHVPCTPDAPRAECGTKVVNHFGILSITTAAGTEIIRRPGFAVTIAAPGAPPSAPRKVTQAEVAETNAEVSSKPGQSGGTGNRVTGAVVAGADTVGPVLAQVGTAVISQQNGTANRPRSSAETLGLDTSPLSPTTPTQIIQVANNVNNQVRTQNSQTAAAASGTVQTSPQAFALAYSSSSTLTPTVLGTANGYNSSILGYADGGNNSDGTPNKTARVIQGGLALSGSGSSQTSALYVVTGTSTASMAGRNVFNGGLSGTRQSAGVIVGASGGAVGAGSDVVVNNNYALTSINARPGTIDADGNITPGAGRITVPGQASQSFDYTVNAATTTTPNGLGGDRRTLDTVPNAYFGGYAAGISTTTTGGRAVAAPAIVTGLLDLSFDAKTSQFGVALGMNSSNADGNSLQNAFFDYGKAINNFFTRPETADGRGTYVDYKNFGAREAVSPTGSYTSTVNGQAVTSHQGVFVTSDLVNAKANFSDVTFCNCDYTRWGLWSSVTERTANGLSLTDSIHLGTWVSGVPTEAGSIPSTGTATYDGHAVATFQSGTSQYVAAGTFQNSVNFGTRTGTATISNLDGRTYSGTVSVAASGSNGIYGSLATTSGTAATMQLNGLFGQGTIGAAGEVYGQLTVSGTNYLGAGIFSGATRSIGTGGTTSTSASSF